MPRVPITAALAVAIFTVSACVGGSPTTSQASPTKQPAAPTNVSTAQPPATASADPTAPTELSASLDGPLPAGWTAEENPLTITTTADGPGMTIEVLPDRELMAASCALGPEPGVDTTAEAIVTALAARPGLIATDQAPAMVGGLSGWQVDLSVDPAVPGSCDEGGFAPLVGFTGDLGWEFTGIGPKDRLRLVALDAPGDGNFTIHVWGTNAAAFDKHIGAALEMLGRLRFSS